jgi:pimeloyl-ACP methyl ester carboxylesterase
LEPIEALLAAQPQITVPTVSLHGECDGVSLPGNIERETRHFTGLYQHRVIPIAGHFLPREAPEAVVQAVEELAG